MRKAFLGPGGGGANSCLVSVHASVAALEEGCLFQQRGLVIVEVRRSGQGGLVAY